MTKYFKVFKTFKRPEPTDTASTENKNSGPNENLTDEPSATKTQDNITTSPITQQQSVHDETRHNDEIEVPNIITTAPSTMVVEIECAAYKKVPLNLYRL